MTIASSLSTLTAALKHIGVDFPAPVVKAFAARDKLKTLTATMPAVTNYDVTAAAATAMLEGRDPLDDKTVLRALLASVMTGDGFGLQRSMGRHADDRIAQALTENRGAVAQILHDAAAAAGDELAKAVEVLGDADLNDSARILGLGPIAAEAWADAKRNTKTVQLLEDAWVALADLTQHANPATIGFYRLTDAGLDVREQVGSYPNPWSLVQAGAAIDLALDAADVQDREARHNAEREQRVSAGREATQAAVRRTFAFN